MLEVTHHFVIEFERVGGGAPTLQAHIQQVADALHEDPSVMDVAVGANLAAGTVEFELGARGVSTRAALDVAWSALLRAFQASGGAVTDAFHERVDREAGAPPSDAVEQWQQKRTELVDA